MKKTIKIVAGIIISLYLIMVVFTTAFLLNRNDYGVSSFLGRSLVLVDENWESEYKKDALLFIKPVDAKDIKEGDKAFFYDTYSSERKIKYIEVTKKEAVNENETTFTMKDNSVVSSQYLLGTHDSTFSLNFFGKILSLFQSRWGFLLIVVLPLFLAFLYEIYAIYREIVNTSSISVAKWQVKINNDNISGSSSTFTINNINWTESENVKSGKVAPEMDGYFDIEIDPNNTETSVRYDITFDFTNLDSSQFVINEIKEIDEKEIVRTGEFTYSNIFTLDEINNNETNTIRVYLSWINDELNNEKDSNLGKVANNTIKIPVVVEITQHFDGETLTEYTGE